MSGDSGAADIISAVSAAVAAAAAAWAVRESARARESNEASRRLRDTIDEFKEHVTRPVLSAVELYAHDGVKLLSEQLPAVIDPSTGTVARRALFNDVLGRQFVLRIRLEAYAHSLGAGQVARRFAGLLNSHEDQLAEALEMMVDLPSLRSCQMEYWVAFRQLMTLVLAEENAIAKRFEKRQSHSTR